MSWLKELLADPAVRDAVHQALVYFALASATVLTGFLGKALNALSKKWGLEGEAVNKANKEADILVALKAGIIKAAPVIEEHGWHSQEAHAEILKIAADYLLQQFPSRASSLGGATGDKVHDALSARLPEAVAIAAASPATPPADPGATTTVTTTDGNAAGTTTTTTKTEGSPVT